jgi:isoleucyl-tRNA synthetase
MCSALAQVMPYSTGLSTPLANFEANQNYKDTVDPSVMVRTVSLRSFHI